MKRNHLLLTVLAWSLCGGAAASPDVPRPEANPDAKPVEASFTGLDGKGVRLSDIRNKKAIVLLFMRGFTGEFACHFCSLQVKDYKALAREFQEAGADVWVVLPGAKDGKEFYAMVGTDDADNPEPGFTAPFPVLLDTDFSACKAFDVPFDPEGEPFPVSQPATIVVGKEGKILHAWHGEKVMDRPSAKGVLAALKGKDAKTPLPKDVSTPPAPVASTAEWLPFEKGLETAKAVRKPILVDFYADW